MKRKLTAAMTCLIGTLTATPSTLAQDANVIVEWNQMLQLVAPNWRAYAIAHIAMFDAVNSVEGKYTPYRMFVPHAFDASPEAAAAQAARDVLAFLFPAQRQTFNNLLASQLVGLPAGRLQEGRTVGARVAQAVLAWRNDDGWPAAVSPDPVFVLPPFPGLWQPAPPANSLAMFTFYPNALPFALETSTQFLPTPPPELNSERYAADFNETKELGAVDSLTRTPEETLLAQLFTGVNTIPAGPILFTNAWNNVARDVAQERGLNLVDTARLFALLNVSLNDALQTSFTSKFVYRFWRPVTAIRRADEDLNDATIADPDWTPFLATPPYPTYAGNAACLAAASARALELVFGPDDIPFSVTWVLTTGDPVTREFRSFSELAEKQARSRIHGGIHFQFDSDASLAVCPQVAEFVHANYMTPR